jgi:lysophospholipase L1-like esterase
MFKHYVALGDSLAEGVSDWGRGDTRIGFVYILADALRSASPALKLTNLGVGGARVADVLRNQLPMVSTRQPDFITLVIGANDVPNTAIEQFAKDYQAVMRGLTAEDDAKIVVATVPNFGHLLPPQFASYRTAVEERVHAFNRVILETAAAHNALVVDLQGRQEIQDRRNISADGVHPNARGYRIMAQAFIETLTQAFPSLMLPLIDADR